MFLIISEIYLFLFRTHVKYIILTEENMAKEHICCAFSDKKCTAGYELKKGSDSL